MTDLYLFDIDGTLVDMTPLHVAAYKKAYRNVTGIDVNTKLLTRQFGNAERKIHEAIFRHYGLKDPGRIDWIISAWESNVKLAIRKARVKMLPGVKIVLRRLKRERHILGVVTGNSRVVGEAILKKAGIYGCFSVYSYGSANGRAHIVRTAINAAKRKGRFGKVVVIGDSPFDVKAGKQNNAVTVAVATGRYSLAELKMEKPDFAIKSLRRFSAV